MCLSRFARALERWRANGSNSESSAVSSPARFNFSSRGIESLIPTPSSAVSHIKTPEDYWSTGILEHWEETPPPSIPIFHYSILPHFILLQTVLLYPIHYFDSFGKPDIGK